MSEEEIRQDERCKIVFGLEWILFMEKQEGKPFQSTDQVLNMARNLISGRQHHDLFEAIMNEASATELKEAYKQIEEGHDIEGCN